MGGRHAGRGSALLGNLGSWRSYGCHFDVTLSWFQIPQRYCLDTAELFWQLKGDLHNIRKMVEDVLESLLVGTSKLHASGGRRRGQVRCVASTRP